MTEFDAGRDFTKTHHVLRAVRWCISAWDSVDVEKIRKCWIKGFKSTSSAPAARWKESIPLINELQQTVHILSKDGDNERIHERMDTHRFIDNDEEQFIDSDQELTDEIVNQYTVQPVEESEEDEQPVQPEVRVPISEAIAAAKT